MTLKGRVSPFGNPRIKACSQLPTAYRSVPRPSSPLGAKASTRCPCQTLDRFSHKPIQTRPKHPPKPKGLKPIQEQSPDETMTAVKSLAFLSPAIQASKSRPLLSEKPGPRANPQAHRFTYPTIPGQTISPQDETAIRPTRPNPKRAKGGKPKTPKRAKRLSQDAEYFFFGLSRFAHLEAVSRRLSPRWELPAKPRSNRPRAGSA